MTSRLLVVVACSLLLGAAFALGYTAGSSAGDNVDEQVTALTKDSPTATEADAAKNPEVTENPFTLDSTVIRGVNCNAKGGSIDDLAWFDVTWSSETDLDGFTVELVDAHGVTKVGPALTVPPRNFGGDIDFSGASTWDSRKTILDSTSTIGALTEDTETHYVAAGETGLLALHLRFDPEVTHTRTGATIPAIRATYYDADGNAAQTELKINQRWKIGTC